MDRELGDEEARARETERVGEVRRGKRDGEERKGKRGMRADKE